MGKVHPVEKAVNRIQRVLNEQHARPRQATMTMAKKTKRSKELND